MAGTAAVDERFVELLRQQREAIVKRWVRLARPALRGRLTDAELSRQSSGLLDALLTVLESGKGVDLESGEPAELRAVLIELSASRARRSFSSTETATSVFALKEAVLEVLQARTDPATLAEYLTFSQVVDQMGLLTFESYVATREELVSQQAEQLLELSTPVVKVWEGVVAVPLVGTLDSARAQTVMEKLLQTLVDTESAYAIIDITGVPAVDTQVAQHVLKTIVAARLMGATCVISGIRPQIAQTIVALGIEFGDIATKATLADALRYVLRAKGVDLVRVAPARAS